MQNPPKIKDIYHAFLAELRAAANGEQTSIPYITHTLPSRQKKETDETIQVLVIGGTNCISAHVQITKGTARIIKKEHRDIPSFTTKDIFLQFVESLIDTAMEKIAVNFSHAIEPQMRNGFLDGKFMFGAKEHPFHGLEGQCVGEEVKNHIQTTQKRGVSVSVANDTICLLLSGLTVGAWDTIACGIVGTGMNMALFQDENTLVNLESGEFSSFDQSPEGTAIDTKSEQPGNALFEKEVSGAYLYQHYNIRAAEKGVPLISSTEELSDLAEKGKGEECDIARSIFSHSARLTGAQIAAISTFHSKHITFVMEGSLFWQAWQYKGLVQDTVSTLEPHHPVHFVEVPDSSVIGAAQLF
jgi:hexokinase